MEFVKEDKMPYCSACGKQNPESAKFCKGCGTTLGQNQACPKCGIINSPEAEICSSCGAPLKAEAPVAAPAAQAVPPLPPVVTPPAPKPGKSRKRWVIPVVIVVAAIVTCAIVGVFQPGGSPPPQGGGGILIARGEAVLGDSDLEATELNELEMWIDTNKGDIIGWWKWKAEAMGAHLDIKVKLQGTYTPADMDGAPVLNGTTEESAALTEAGETYDISGERGSWFGEMDDKGNITGVITLQNQNVQFRAEVVSGLIPGAVDSDSSTQTGGGPEPAKYEWADITHLFTGTKAEFHATGTVLFYFMFDIETPSCDIQYPKSGVEFSFIRKEDFDRYEVPEEMRASLVEGALSGQIFSASEGQSYSLTFDCNATPALVIGKGDIQVVE